MSSRPTSFVSLSTIKPLARRNGPPKPSGSLSHRAAAGQSSWNGGLDTRSKPIIALCHLSWDWVWQRPQQFLSRLAKTHPVLFVETYCSDVPQTTVRLRSVDAYPNLTICEMHLPASRWNDGRYIDGERRRALRRALSNDLAGRFERAILWFNDPMAVTAFAGHLGESLIVYDCMDELSQFKGAPPTLVERERDLLEVADVVFCGGRKMRDKRLRVNPNSYFYGTGVDCRHFGSAQSATLAVDPEIAELDGPILGYFGVVDERIDYELLATLADADPSWHVVIVGPWTKVDPAEFPRRRNLHWFGARPYAQLPSITKGFTVCLMPFALNEATEYINPTKALEYMAAGRPVISTALDEVKSNFANVARIARSHEEFVTLCRREVNSPSQTRIARGLKLAAENTWEAILEKMEGHIADAFAAEAETAVETTSIVPLVGEQSAYV